MSIKRVIVTGAGFSVPANLPVQNRILDLMKKKPTPSFMDDVTPNSIKFMNAYIRVGLYLLDKYTANSHNELIEQYNEIQKKSLQNEFIENLYNDFANNKIEVGKEAIDFLRNQSFDNDKKYQELNLLVENVRNAIVYENIDVNLEDVFTSFDKSLEEKEFLNEYSYSKMDVIRLSLTRLFVYYFDREVHNHDFQTEDYLNFIKYIKTRRSSEPLSIITTNWDTLLEEYFSKNTIDYNLCLNEKYYITDDEGFGNEKTSRVVNLIKIHGSINWFRCLKCNSLCIFKKKKIAELLFNDDRVETCLKCNSHGDEETEILQPELVTPTMIKSIDHQLYKNLWNAAATELRNADEIIFIGYSLPIADYEFRYLLQKSIPKEAVITVVLHNSDKPIEGKDNNHLPEKRYRDLFPKNLIKFNYSGFKEFFCESKKDKR